MKSSTATSRRPISWCLQRQGDQTRRLDARQGPDRHVARQVTQLGELVGDVRYMSPERTRSDAEVDGRSDIYSLAHRLRPAHRPAAV